MRTILLAAVFAASVSTTPAFAADPAMTAQTTKGPTLVDAKSMTLYTFDKDTAGKSACNGPCAANWPPLAAPASATTMGSYAVVTRDDGSKQWAYKDKPLYTWAKDTKPGDITGDGFLNGAWHVAQP